MSDELVRKVPPKEDLPAVGKKLETRLAKADAKSAEGYDALEEATTKIGILADAIDSGRVIVELDMTDTAVHALKEHLKKDEPKP